MRFVGPCLHHHIPLTWPCASVCKLEEIYYYPMHPLTVGCSWLAWSLSVPAWQVKLAPSWAKSCTRLDSGQPAIDGNAVHSTYSTHDKIVKHIPQLPIMKPH